MSEKDLDKKDWDNLDICCICHDELFNSQHNPYLDRVSGTLPKLENVNRFTKVVPSIGEPGNLDDNEGNQKQVPVRKILMCGHMFHSLCIVKQLEIEERCPLCKEYLDIAAMLIFDLRNSLMFKKVCKSKNEVTYQKKVKINEVCDGVEVFEAKFIPGEIESNSRDESVDLGNEESELEEEQDEQEEQDEDSSEDSQILRN